MSELLLAKVGTAVLTNRNQTKLDLRTISDIADDINAHEEIGQETFWGDSASTILVSSGAFAAGREGSGLTNHHLAGLDEVERAKLKLRYIDERAHQRLAEEWSHWLGRDSLYKTIGELDLVTASQKHTIAHGIAYLLDKGTIPIFNNDDHQSLRELDDVVQVEGGERHIMPDNDYTLLSIVRLAMTAGFVRHLGVTKGQEDRYQAATVVYLTNTNGVLENVEAENSGSYDCLSVSDARAIADESLTKRTKKQSNGGMYSKLHTAATIAEEADVRVVIANGKGRYALKKVLEGEAGTEIRSK